MKIDELIKSLFFNFVVISALLNEKGMSNQCGPNVDPYGHPHHWSD